MNKELKKLLEAVKGFNWTVAVKVRKEAEEKYFKPLIDGLKAEE